MTLTSVQGNPAYSLKDAYAELMKIEDVDVLVLEAMKIARSHLGHGMSARKHQQFLHELLHARTHGLTAVRFYLTNFMLAADGLSVIRR